MTDRTRVAILGGGIGALTTAFELTDTPELREKYEVTVHTLGWRLGGKCATGRGPDGRIEEHGIHGFLGCYYNALPLVSRIFEALDRPADHPLPSFAKAFRQENFVLMWEVDPEGAWRKWPLTMPTNDRDPADPEDVSDVTGYMKGIARFLDGLIDTALESGDDASGILGKLKKGTAELLDAVIGGHPEGAVRTMRFVLDGVWAVGGGVIRRSDSLRHLFFLVDYPLALLEAMIKYDIEANGFDSIDHMNFDEMLKDCGAKELTITSPMALNTPNLSYQYPMGDTSRPPRMAAGTYLHWSLRSFAYFGSFAWVFEVGTGESVISPAYDALKKRGVTFEFFSKVEALRLSDDGRSIGAVEIAVQATTKGGAAYHPYAPKKIAGIDVWPAAPNHDQLEQGEALAKGEELPSGGYDLESWWTAWTPVATRTLTAGEDFDQLVFAISIGAIPYVCGDILALQDDRGAAWRAMVEGIPTVQTQAMQIWLNKSNEELGLGIDMPDNEPNGRYETDNIVIGATFTNPQSGMADFTHLMAWEDWAERPKALWYMCGPMDDYDPVPPFSDHGYPKRMDDRVMWQSIQWLQAAFGSIDPKATVAVQRPPGDAKGLDFDLLVCTSDDGAEGVTRFRQQFHRANIDPTERYVTSPPGSTAVRMKAWETGFDNLHISGDWVYTGLNVGSVEGTVMGGRACAHGISGAPRLEDIPGYLLGAGTKAAG